MEKVIRAKYYNDFSSNMCRLRPDDRFHDIEVHVRDEVFNCHRFILSSASEFFDVMFKKNFKEGSTQEIVLGELDPRVFEVMLKFMYTGKADIEIANLYDVFRAAELYKLPRLIELCVTFIKENLNAVAEEILIIFWYAHRAAMEEVVAFLGRHIYENFGYFSKVAEFRNLSVDGLLKILEEVDEKRIIPLQDSYLEGVYTWIQCRENLNVDEKKSYSEKLLKKIDFTRFSDQYTKDRLEECMAGLRSPDESIPNAVQSCPKLLHAYISTPSSDRNKSMEMSVWAGFSSASPSTWAYEGEVTDCDCHYVENLVVQDTSSLIYSLAYSRYLNRSGYGQTFRCSPQATLYPYTPLSLPPIVGVFDMCGSDNEIYLYNKYSSCRSSEDSPFSEEECRRGVFLYKRDIDKWFPLPRPKVEAVFASLTLYDGRLYLLGGSPYDEDGMTTVGNSIQAYDVRTREWCELSPMKYSYSSAASCVYEKAIFVLGNSDHSSPGEIYDPTSGNSRPLPGRNTPRYESPKIVNLSDTLVSFDRYSLEISRYSPDTRDWISLPDINDAYVDTKDIPEYGISGFLDIIMF